MRHAVVVLMCLAAPAGAASAQSVIDPPPFTKTVNLSGPRFGLTALSTGVVDELHKRNIDVGPNISQFGWQFEKQFYSGESGVAAVNEWVILLGGLDQGVALPSVSWLVGLRTREGAEFGIGPNITRPAWRWPRRRRDVPRRQLQRADERGRGAVEGRHAQHPDRIQHARLRAVSARLVRVPKAVRRSGRSACSPAVQPCRPGRCSATSALRSTLRQGRSADTAAATTRALRIAGRRLFAACGRLSRYEGALKGL